MGHPPSEATMITCLSARSLNEMREIGGPGCDNDHVSPTPAQRAQARRIARELAALGFALPGTLADRMTRCGHANCRCHADPPQLHGPYHQWTRRKAAKPPPASSPTTSSPTTSPGSTTTAGSASSSPNSKPSASTPPKPTPAGTANPASRCGHSPLNLWAAPGPPGISPVQTQT
jgi:hypothetical protein